MNCEVSLIFENHSKTIVFSDKLPENRKILIKYKATSDCKIIGARLGLFENDNSLRMEYVNQQLLSHLMSAKDVIELTWTWTFLIDDSQFSNRFADREPRIRKILLDMGY